MPSPESQSRPSRVTQFGALSAVALALAACSTAKMAGGEPLIPGDEPDGDQVGLWRTEHCMDRKGGPAVEPAAKVQVIRTKDRKLILVDTRIGYDTVVSDNGELRGGEWVFDVALKKEHGQPYLRQYRLPESLGASGRYLLTADFEDWDAGDAFHARLTTVAVQCTLAAANS